MNALLDRSTLACLVALLGFAVLLACPPTPTPDASTVPLACATPAPAGPLPGPQPARAQ